jgi:hypothetical protein
MRKIWPIFLVALVLSWLLAWGPLPAGAYYPPLQATGSAGDSGFSFSVTLPQGGSILANGGYPPGTTVSNFINNRIMAWVVSAGSTSTVEYCTFDPFVNDFIFGSPGEYYEEVSQLTVADGVVAYVAKDTASGPSRFCYATYDPAKAAWQKSSFSPEDDPYVPLAYGLIYQSNSGVLLFSYQYNSKVNGQLLYTWTVDVYDPIWGGWAASLGSLVGVVSDTPYKNLTLKNGGTVFYTTGDKYETTNVMYGYDVQLHSWEEGPAKAWAYFVAQPTSGSSPLGVWFTDMSIGGTNWSWTFGDGDTSTSRSPYHTFQSDGYFPVTQKVTGSGTSYYSKTISVGVTPPLVWFAAYSSMASSEDLTLMRRYRDEVLSKDPRGKVYKDQLYDNSDAALTVLMDNPELLAQARNLINANMGAVVQVLQGHEGTIYDPNEVLIFLQSFEEYAPPQLKALINVVQKEMRQSQQKDKTFLGFRLGAKGRGHSRD